MVLVWRGLVLVCSGGRMMQCAVGEMEGLLLRCALHHGRWPASSCLCHACPSQCAALNALPSLPAVRSPARGDLRPGRGNSMVGPGHAGC